MPLVASPTPPVLTQAQREWLEKATLLVNRSGPASSQDSVVAAGSMAPSTASAPRSVQPLAAGDILTINRALTDPETNNLTSVINEPSVAANWPRVFVTANWYATFSSNGMGTFSYLDANLLPPIAGQTFCCDQSVVYDAKRNIFIWVSLFINGAATTGTLRFSVLPGDFSGLWVYDFTSASFGLAGLPDYPHIALGANSLYVSMNHFNPNFTQATVARFPLLPMSQAKSFSFNFVNRPEFNMKVAHDYGPGTKAYWATHINNTTLRVFRWQEGSPTFFFNDVTLPRAWTRGGRGQFVCTTPGGFNPCARMDDRLMGGFVTGPKKLPAGSTAQEVVGFTWTGRQGGTFPLPYTEVVRIDAETMVAIDQPALWNNSFALFYGDFEPNERGDLAGVVDVAGATSHPAVWAVSLRDESAIPAPWDVFALKVSTHSPPSNTWGDYNTVRMIRPYGNMFLAATHTLQGGGANGDVETLLTIITREGDLP